MQILTSFMIYCYLILGHTPLIVALWWMICWLRLLMPMNSRLKDLIDHACTLRHTPFIEIIWSFVDFMIVWCFCWFVWVITLSVYHFSLSSLSLLLFSPKPFSLFLIIDRSFILVSILGVLGWKSRTWPFSVWLGYLLSFQCRLWHPFVLVSFMTSFYYSIIWGIPLSQPRDVHYLLFWSLSSFQCHLWHPFTSISFVASFS